MPESRGRRRGFDRPDAWFLSSPPSRQPCAVRRKSCSGKHRRRHARCIETRFCEKRLGKPSICQELRQCVPEMNGGPVTCQDGRLDCTVMKPRVPASAAPAHTVATTAAMAPTTVLFVPLRSRAVHTRRAGLPTAPWSAALAPQRFPVSGHRPARSGSPAGRLLTRQARFRARRPGNQDPDAVRAVPGTLERSPELPLRPQRRVGCRTSAVPRGTRSGARPARAAATRRVPHIRGPAAHLDRRGGRLRARNMCEGRRANVFTVSRQTCKSGCTRT